MAVYRDFFHALVAFSKHRLMTTFFNYENPEFLGISSYMPDFPVSSIVDNLILMSLVEINNSLHRCISVVKARGCHHSFDTREFVDRRRRNHAHTPEYGCRSRSPLAGLFKSTK